MGGPNDRGLLVMAMDTDRAVIPVFYEKVLFIFRIVWLVTGSAHQFPSGAEKYRVSFSPLLWDVCCLSREEIKGMSGAIEGWVF
jgi:hypothetical protein